MKTTLRRLHRWIALALGMLWLSQALTGLLMVYRWELDDAPHAGAASALDVDALGARIEAIEGTTEHRKVTSLWATGGVDGRFDLYVDDAVSRTDVVRVDGTGTVLRTRASGEGFIPTAADLHQTLLLGDTGKAIVGTSGLLLLAAVALAQFPGSALSGVTMPSAGSPWYRIRVRQPGEWRRVYGTTVVYVAAANGRVLRTEDALQAPAKTAFMSNLYSVHTGEALGTAGRVLVFGVALWLLAMLMLGVGLWSARRRRRA